MVFVWSRLTNGDPSHRQEDRDLVQAHAHVSGGVRSLWRISLASRESIRTRCGYACGQRDPRPIRGGVQDLQCTSCLVKITPLEYIIRLAT